MNASTLAVLVCLTAIATASRDPHGGAVVSGPSGVVTSHGAIGPAGYDHGLAYGAYGHGLGYGHDLHANSVVVGHGLGYGALGYGAGLGYSRYGHGLGYGYGIGHGLGYGHDGGVAVGHHGVTVQGPPTAPAVVAGPSGKIIADGLWGPTSHWAHGGHEGHGW